MFVSGGVGRDGKVVGALYGRVNGGDRVDCVPSAFESAPTDPTMAVAYESCGPVLQVGGVGGRALGPRHGPSRSVADLKTLLQRQGATTMPRTEAKRPLQFLKGCGFSCCRRVPQHQAREGFREMREFPGLARLVLR